jgi:hypothetical protein
MAFLEEEKKMRERYGREKLERNASFLQFGASEKLGR